MATMMSTRGRHPSDKQSPNSDERRVTQSVMNARYLTIDEVAAYLNMKVKTLYTKLPEIRHYKVGHLIRFKKEDIDTWMESQRRDVVTRSDIPAKSQRSAHRKESHVDAIVRKAIDEVTPPGYTSPSGKSDRIESLGKE